MSHWIAIHHEFRVSCGSSAWMGALQPALPCLRAGWPKMAPTGRNSAQNYDVWQRRMREPLPFLSHVGQIENPICLKLFDVKLIVCRSRPSFPTLSHFFKVQLEKTHTNNWYAVLILLKLWGYFRKMQISSMQSLIIQNKRIKSVQSTFGYYITGICHLQWKASDFKPYLVQSILLQVKSSKWCLK